jgi:uncharacterized protein YndB with AHSA1/START domain
MTASRSAEDLGDGTFSSQRLLAYPAQQVFAAFAQPDLLARWWGPDGFTNSFEVFEFQPGGRWIFVMHGPNDTHHPNESVFLQLDPPETLVIQHVSQPRYTLAVRLIPHDGGTTIRWVQQFEDPAVAARIRHIVEPANEQNLDRLASVLAYGSAKGKGRGAQGRAPPIQPHEQPAR